MISNQYPNIVYTLVNGVPVAAGTITIGSGGQLILTPSGPAAIVPPQVYDPINNVYYTLTAPNGVLTLT